MKKLLVAALVVLTAASAQAQTAKPVKQVPSVLLEESAQDAERIKAKAVETVPAAAVVAPVEGDVTPAETPLVEPQRVALLTFAAGQAVLSGNHVADLDALVEMLKTNPQARIQVIATSSAGNATESRIESIKRLTELRGYLHSKGIDLARVDARAPYTEGTKGLDVVEVLKF